MRHVTHRYLRKPVAVITLSAIIPGAYDGMMVICDDGATFASWPDGDKPREWIEGSPIPGTVRDMNLGGTPPIREGLATLLPPPPVEQPKPRSWPQDLAILEERRKKATEITAKRKPAKKRAKR